LSFNPVMGLLTQAVVPLCGASPAVLEFGNQSFRVDRPTLDRIIARGATLRQDVAGLTAINALDATARRDRAAAYYACLGARSYTAIDVNDTYGSLVMDLNKDLATEYQFRDQFDLVTNNGTGEHVFDQGAIFRNAHALTRAGGLMVHVMPFVNYVNHGFYSYHPNLYHALAVANRYQVLALGMATRDGNGVVAIPDPAGEALATFLVKSQRVDLGTLLTEPKVPRRNAPRRWLELLVARMPGASSKLRFGLYIHRLLVQGRKILVFAVLKKTDGGAFTVPIQLRYSEDVSAEGLERSKAQAAAGSERVAADAHGTSATGARVT